MIKSATDLIIVTNAAVGGAEVTVTVDPRTATAGLDTLDTIATAQTWPKAPNSVLHWD